MKTTKEKKKEVETSIIAMVKSIQSGDPTQRNDFAKAVLNTIKPVVNKFYRDPTDRQEAMNFVVIKLLNKISFIDITKPVLNYILYTANNYCIDEYRKKKRKAGKIVTMDTETLDLFPTQDRTSSLKYEDYIDLYTVATKGNQDHADLIYNLEQEKKTPEELSYSHKLPVETIKDIHKDALHALKIIKRKLILSKA